MVVVVGPPYHLPYRVNIDAYTHVCRLPKLALKLSMPMEQGEKGKGQRGLLLVVVVERSCHVLWGEE